MPTFRSSLRRRALALASGTALAGLLAAAVAPAPSDAMAFSLPLGDADLTEVRTVQPLAPGVELVRIVRGSSPALPEQVPTTSRGPWRVDVLSIDPRSAAGHLEATYGPDLAQVEPVSQLVQAAGALAGVNSSFFTFDKNPQYPGDPVGLGLYRGAVLSEPAAVRPEVDLVVDGKTNQVLIGRLTWSGSMRNRKTGDVLTLEHLNHPPVVPAACAELTDPTACTASGDVVQIDRRFGPTPTGRGVEVVLDRSGCLVRSSRQRGTVLAAGQSALQATGRQTKTLLKLVKQGCLSRRVTLRDEKQKALKLHAGMFGVAGRYRLTQGGRIVVPQSADHFFDRHPRTIAGTTPEGKILLVTIDGRQTTSVGATLAETAAVAQALDLVDSVNLDGGGSTTMALGSGVLVNQPSGGTQRAVGDALVYVDRPFR